VASLRDGSVPVSVYSGAAQILKSTIIEPDITPSTVREIAA